jgi:nitrite reductase/ring-hydroxylating ferredoxin subunit
MSQKGFVNFRQTFKNNNIRRQGFANFDESANQINAHCDCVRAIKDICGHKGAVLGEGKRTVTASAM